MACKTVEEENGGLCGEGEGRGLICHETVKEREERRRR